MVEAHCGGQVLVRQMKSASGYMSAGEPVIHLGLGDHEAIDHLIVRWPSGHEQAFADVAPGQAYTVYEPGVSPSEPVAGTPASATNTTHFTLSTLGQQIKHEENAFDEFVRESLLPNRMSTRGPGVSVTDIDGDGIEEFYIGGASGQFGRIYAAHNDRWLTRVLSAVYAGS